MTAIFISHASADSAQAASIRSWLAEMGFENVFLDLDKSAGLRVGENWERRLYEEVARCHAIVVLVTPAWLNSKWCFAEYSMARSQGKTVFPVLLTSEHMQCVGPELGSIQVEIWNSEGKTHLAEQLGRVAHEIARGHRYTSDRPPYPGFLSFEAEDAAVFFGRDVEIRQIGERLEARRVHGGARMLMVVGPSGSGKSSVVKAGLLPYLQRETRRWIIVPPMRPSEAPMVRLAKALAETMKSDHGWHHLHQQLLRAPRAVLNEVADILQVGPAREATVLLTIDQFEEVFSLAREDESAAFLSILDEIGSGRVPVVVLSTVRSDLLGQILRDEEFDVPHEVYTLGHLSPDRLPQVIEGPAQVAAFQLDRQLTRRIIDDAVNAGALPLLAFALREMHDRYGHEGRLTLLHYESLGRQEEGLSPLENAIRLKAEETITEAAPSPAELHALKEAFVDGLVRVNDEHVRLRRPAPIAELPEAARPLIQRLVDARLLSAREDSEGQVVEVAHEALFRAWPQLSRWLDAEQDFLIGRRHLEEVQRIWAEAPEEHKHKALLTGLLLEKARDWIVQYPERLTDMRPFIAESVRAHETEAHRARRRQLILTTVSLVAALVFAGLGGMALYLRGQAEQAAHFANAEANRAQESAAFAAVARQQAEERFAMALGAVAQGLTGEDPRLGLYLAGEAAARAGEAEPSFYAREAMMAARQALAKDGPHLLGSPIPVGDALSLAMTSDGSTLAIGMRDGSLRIIDVMNHVLLGSKVQAHDGGIEDLAMQYNGRLLVSAGSGGEVVLWHLSEGHVTSGEVVARLDDVAWSVDVDPTGVRFAAGGQDRQVHVWPLNGEARLNGARTFATAADALSVAFSPNGSAILGGTGGGTIHAWDVESGREIFPTIDEAHSSEVWDILFAPIGNLFATVSSDGSSGLFAYPSGEFIKYALPREHAVSAAIFGPHGRHLIGGSDDGRLHVSALQSGDVSMSVRGHTGRIMGIVADVERSLLATLARDQTVRFWTFAQPTPVSRDFYLSGKAKGLAVSSDGSTVAAADEAGRVYLWREGSAATLLEAHEAEVWALALSPDGARLASADREGVIRVWNPGNGEAEASFSAGAAVWWLGLSPRGDQLFAVGEGGARVYGLARDASPPRLLAEGPFTGGALSSDGTHLALASKSGRVMLLDARSGEHLRQIEVLNDVAWAVAFSPRGDVLAVAGSNETVTLWNPGTGRRIGELGGHKGGATNVGFLSDGVTLASVDRRGHLHLWDVLTHRRLSPAIAAHDAASWRLAVAGSESIFVTSGDDGRVRLWNILSSAAACRIGSAGFDAQHERSYFGGEAERMACAHR